MSGFSVRDARPGRLAPVGDIDGVAAGRCAAKGWRVRVTAIWAKTGARALYARLGYAPAYATFVRRFEPEGAERD